MGSVALEDLMEHDDAEPMVTIHALSAGHLTLPEHLFVQPSVAGNRSTVPSLAFLIQIQPLCSLSSPTGYRPTRILFDLGLRRDLQTYPKPIVDHLKSREPLGSQPDVRDSLKAGGLAGEDIDVVILSHVHWDHVGTPADFPNAIFVVGHGSIQLLEGIGEVDEGKTGSHSHFEAGLLPLDRTIELSDPKKNSAAGHDHAAMANDGMISRHLAEKGANASSTVKSLLQSLSTTIWSPHALSPSLLPRTTRLFPSVPSIQLVSAPGHLQGHTNVLIQLPSPSKPPSSSSSPALSQASTSTSSYSNPPPSSSSTTTSYIYLAGDACHDRRILNNTLSIAQWHDDTTGEICCIHIDRDEAIDTCKRIRGLELLGQMDDKSGPGNIAQTDANGDGTVHGMGHVNVEVILAHDKEWLENEENESRFWPGML